MMHLDIKQKQLREGFYGDTHSGRLHFFTGKYSLLGHAFAESEYGGLQEYTEALTCEWFQIDDPLTFSRNSKQDVSWMQSKLEQEAQKLLINA